MPPGTRGLVPTLFVPRPPCGRSGDSTKHLPSPTADHIWLDGVSDALTDSLRRLRDTTSPTRTTGLRFAFHGMNHYYLYTLNKNNNKR
jgi:hypothetical protein